MKNKKAFFHAYQILYKSKCFLKNIHSTINSKKLKSILIKTEEPSSFIKVFRY